MTATAPAESIATKKLRTLLGGAGIEADPFIAKLSSSEKPLTPEAFIANLEETFGNTELAHANAAVAMRFIHMESNNPFKTYNIIKQMGVVYDANASTLSKLGASVSLVGNTRNLAKHYYGFGFRSLASVASKLFINVENTPKASGFAWPKIRIGRPEHMAERSLSIVDDILVNIQRGRGNHSAISHLAKFFDLTPEAFQAIPQAAQNVLKDPKLRAQILNAIKKGQNTGANIEQLGSKEIGVALNEVLKVVGKFHNEKDTKRIADAISIVIDKSDGTPLEKLTRYWEAAKAPLQTAEGAVVTAGKAVEAVSHKISFANHPLVNLGVAVASIGGTILVGHNVAKKKVTKHEYIDANGTRVIDTNTIPAGFWQRTEKFVGITALLAVCGIATFRAAGLPDKSGISFVERMLSRSAPVAKEI